jgi:ankyrin repeat protein
MINAAENGHFAMVILLAYIVDKKEVLSLEKVLSAVENNGRIDRENGHIETESKYIEMVEFSAPTLSQNKSLSLDKVLSAAAKNGHIEIVKWCLYDQRRAVSIPARKDALNIAAGTGHLEVVRHLLRNVASIKNINKILLVASAAGNNRVVQLLLEEAGPIGDEDRHSMLARAAVNGHVKTVQYLKGLGWQLDKAKTTDLFQHLRKLYQYEVLNILDPTPPCSPRIITSVASLFGQPSSVPGKKDEGLPSRTLVLRK